MARLPLRQLVHALKDQPTIIILGLCIHVGCKYGNVNFFEFGKHSALDSILHQIIWPVEKIQNNYYLDQRFVLVYNFLPIQLFSDVI